MRKMPFWNIPLRHCERRYYCGRIRLDGVDKYVTYLRTAQGSRGAPLSWAVIFSLIGRCVLSTLRETRKLDSVIPAAMQIFVDDPWLALRGTPEQTARMTAVVIIAWRLLGVSLAFPKGQLGASVNWIGASLSIEATDRLTITIVQSRLDELRVMCRQMLSGNTVSLKSLRSFTGKCQSVASILHTWRPFVHMLYASLHSSTDSRPHEGSVWTKQIQVPTDWIACFLDGHRSDLVRVMTLDAHYRRGLRIDITTDASPYGMGAFLCVGGKPVEYFAVATTAQDAKALGLELSTDSKCQQAFEALALLVALRHWRSFWTDRRCTIHVASDNMAALSMVCRMQPHSPSLGVVARELALDISDSVYQPQLASHIPGVANVTADALSRKFEPNRTFVLPSILAYSTEAHPQRRDSSWWRTVRTHDSA